MEVVWTRDLAVGVDLIDGQHQELFRRFDDLLEACARLQGREKLGDLLVFLDEYVRLHFQAEEELMDRYLYPRIEEHRAMHAYFLRRQKKMMEDFQAGGATAALLAKTNKVLLAWFIDHIKQVDVCMGVFLRTRIGIVEKAGK
jgi:hemerythrin